MYSQIHPNNIVQGALGTCYFLCALSSLAERPAFIQRLLDNDQINPKGAHAVWLNLNGSWKQIVVDDHFPIKKDDSEFALGSAREPDRWVNFIEKAYAKAFGSYQIIDGGFEVEALRDLTGAPYEIIEGEDIQRVDAVWKKLLDSDRKGYVMVCSIENKENAVRETKQDNGLFGGHAYSLIACAEVPGKDGRTQRIVQVRNPWGNDEEWNGDWGDNSSCWTEAAKQMVKLKSEADGTFWISIQDFCKHFGSVGICKIHPNFYFNNIELAPPKDASKAGTYQFNVLIEVTTAGKYYFSVDQQDTRLLSTDDPEVQYDSARITIGKIEGETFRHVGTTYDNKRNVSVKCSINPGRYVALIDIDFSTNYIRPVVFSSYGINITSLAESKMDPNQQKVVEQMIWRDYANRDSVNWQNSKQKDHVIRQSGMEVSMTKQTVDKSKTFGLKLFRYQLKDNQYEVSSSITTNDGEQVSLGPFQSEVEIQKEGYQSPEKLSFFIRNPGESKKKGGKMAVSVAQTLSTKPLEAVHCQMPPSMNPFLKKVS